jgi:hypothetical protein
MKQEQVTEEEMDKIKHENKRKLIQLKERWGEGNWPYYQTSKKNYQTFYYVQHLHGEYCKST